MPLAALATAIVTSLAGMQADLFRAAKRMLDEHTAPVATWDELAARVAANAGWSLAPWCGDAECEARVKAETKATIRCIPFEQPVDGSGSCIACGKPSANEVIFARAY